MESDQNVIQHLIRQHLEDLHRAGVRQLPASSPLPVSNPLPASDSQQTPSSQPMAAVPLAAAGTRRLDKQTSAALSTPALTTPAVSKPIQSAPVETPAQSTPTPDVPTPSTPDPNLSPVAPVPPATDAAPEIATDPSVAASTAKPSKHLSKEARIELLAEVDSRVKACQKCEELCSTRTQTVFGVGNPAARLVFLGEAPGEDEDRLGEPFVGKAGQLLDKIIGACTLSRADVYILNILKCRPPGNRNPTDTESKNCDEFLQMQLDIIQPEYICCLGSVAAKNLLDTQTSIGRLRGKFHDWRGIKVLATYHPAYLLRNPSAKADVWKDMQFLMKEMGIELPKRGN